MKWQPGSGTGLVVPAAAGTPGRRKPRAGEEQELLGRAGWEWEGTQRAVAALSATSVISTSPVPVIPKAFIHGTSQRHSAAHGAGWRQSAVLCA